MDLLQERSKIPVLRLDLKLPLAQGGDVLLELRTNLYFVHTVDDALTDNDTPTHDDCIDVF